MLFREIRLDSEEYKAALALRETVLRRPLGLALSQGDLAGEEAQLHYGLFTDNGELLGCVIAAPVSRVEAKIRQTAITPHRQRSGLGRRMLRELESALSAKGFRQLRMHARRDAVGFYEKLGYVVEGEEFIEVTIAHVRMIKALTN